MTFRFLATTLGIAAFLGIAAVAPGQDAPKSSRTRQQAQDASKKASDDAKAGKSDKSADKDTKDAKAAPRTELATFGGGCFWCMEAVFERVPGVKNVVSGFSGGFVPNPSYQLVQTGETGHAEVVQIEFDPAVVSYDELLTWFFKAHNPTTLNRQGPDVGTEYRSVIFFHSEEQKKAALAMYDKLTKARAFRDPIVTKLEPYQAFYPAELYHQDFYRRNKDTGYPYIEEIIKPKLQHLTPRPSKSKAKSKTTAKAKAGSGSSSK